MDISASGTPLQQPRHEYITVPLTLCPQFIPHFLSFYFVLYRYLDYQPDSFVLYQLSSTQIAAMYYSTSVVDYLVALTLTVGSRQFVLAANDWLVPCVQGQCSWDLPADSGSSGTLQIVRFHSYIPTCPAPPLTRIQNPLMITAVGPQHINLRYHLRSRMADHALRPRGDDAGYSARVYGRKLGLRSPLPGRCGGYHRPAA